MTIINIPFAEFGQADIPQKEWDLIQCLLMRQTLDKTLADFLRKRRGEMTYAQFSRKLGITASSLHRLENGQQSITLKTLEQILGRLKAELTDVFHPNRKLDSQNRP